VKIFPPFSPSIDNEPVTKKRILGSYWVGQLLMRASTMLMKRMSNTSPHVGQSVSASGKISFRSPRQKANIAKSIPMIKKITPMGGCE